MKERLIGGFFVVIATLVTLLSGGVVTACCLAMISIIACFEFHKVYELQKTPFFYISVIGTVLIYVSLYFSKDFVLPITIILALLEIAIYVVKYPKYNDGKIQAAIFAFIYISVFLSYIYRIRELEGGIYLAFFVLISSWGNDVFAYLTGSAIGKTKITPNLSPNKSLEGFIGGMVGAGLLGLLFSFAFKSQIIIPWWACVIVAMAGSLPGDIGDLAASAIKRDKGIKDYSHLIPGHGGMVDRIDSILFTAPIIYYLICLFMM